MDNALWVSVSVELRRDNVEPEDSALFSSFVITATFWLLLATAAGLLLSFKFPYPDWATSPLLSFGRLRAIHTNGLSGKAIGGVTYAAQMPAFAAQLTDAQIAAIVDHERTSWGNHGPIITPGQVAQDR